MVLGRSARGVQHSLFTPFAKLFLRIGLTPNTVTIAGTILTTGTALTLLPLGNLFWGPLVLGVLVLTDSIDGIMARESGTAGSYGAFLDSTLDRVADAAIFIGVSFWFFLHLTEAPQILGMAMALANLALGAIVPYVRAKAEALGVDASVGIAERADRVLVVLLAAFLTGLGLSPIVFIVALGLLAAASLITVIQRILAVRKLLVDVDG